MRTKKELGSEWVVIEHPLLIKNFEERVKFYKSQGKKVCVDMMIADVPHINSMICKVLSEVGVDGVTILREVGSIFTFKTYGVRLLPISVKELNIILESV